MTSDWTPPQPARRSPGPWSSTSGASSRASRPSSIYIEVTQVLRLNNICNDLGLDTASAGSAIAWAMELYQRGIITREQTQLDLEWGNYETIERLLFMTAKREGFGDV